ncbi:MAG: hypothetical protein H6Q53_1113 [Deltaproteobacteria bacterium]|nr:hypothetical protein [Deltaproteobacteria bacterium]
MFFSWIFMMINSDALPTKIVRRITRSIIITITDIICVFVLPSYRPQGKDT